MKTIRTMKIKISGQHKADAILANWLTATNWLSNIVYKIKDVNSNRLHKAYYHIVREKFGLPSQLTCTLFRTVSATYKTQRSSKQWSLANYKRKTIPIVWKRDFAVTKKGVTLWSDIIKLNDPRKIPSNWKDSKLLFVKKQWYLILSYEIEIPDNKETGTIVGVDQGIKRIFVASDSNNNKLFCKANHLNHKIFSIQRTRSKVQAVGSRSAKRLLIRMSKHQASVTEHAIHVASKRLVEWADSVGARKIVIENLSNIRSAGKNKGKQLRSKLNKWPYGMFTFYTTYKAAAKGITVETVSPRNTSRMCNKCGHIDESNRHGLKFSCRACGYTADADWNASKNIASRYISIELNSRDTGSHKSPKKRAVS